MNDDRIPVRFGPPQPGEAIVAEESVAAPSSQTVMRFRIGPAHAWGCPCCVSRAPVADALSRLFLARARGDVPWFSSVAVSATPAGEAAVRAALAADQLAAGRFRLIER